jgi:mRNA-degrading endonuclease RelE of RelBE toxin-antitoxin system
MQEIARTLPPPAKAKVRAALDELREDPLIGRALRDELVGYWRYPVGRLRIVYRFDEKLVEVVAIGPRAVIYEEFARHRRKR